MSSSMAVVSVSTCRSDSSSPNAVTSSSATLRLSRKFAAVSSRRSWRAVAARRTPTPATTGDQQDDQDDHEGHPSRLGTDTATGAMPRSGGWSGAPGGGVGLEWHVRMARMSRTTRRLLVLTVTAALVVPTSAYAAAGERADRDRARSPGGHRHLRGPRLRPRPRHVPVGRPRRRASRVATYKQILRFYYPRHQDRPEGRHDQGRDHRRHQPARHRRARPRRAQGQGAEVRPDLEAQQDCDRWRISAAAGGQERGVLPPGPEVAQVERITGDAEFSAGRKPLTLLKPGGRTAYRGKLRNAASTATAPPSTCCRSTTTSRASSRRRSRPSGRRHAVRAQAVAARTYAAFQRADRRDRSATPRRARSTAATPPSTPTPTPPSRPPRGAW